MRLLDKHARRDKQLIALHRELRRLCHAQHHAPIVPLERPYACGWVKFYVLEDQVKRRPDVAMFLTILAAVNRRVYSRARNFIHKNGQRIGIHPRVIPTREWLKFNWPASHRCFFGYGNWRLDDHPGRPIKWRDSIIGFKLVHNWWLREEIQPHLITHQRVDLPKVRSRIAEIEAFFAADHR